MSEIVWVVMKDWGYDGWTPPDFIGREKDQAVEVAQQIAARCGGAVWIAPYPLGQQIAPFTEPKDIVGAEQITASV